MQIENKLRSFIKGKGLDLSPAPYMPDSIAEHFFQEPDNLYLLKQRYYNVESFDFMFAKDIINRTKYYKILLREWFDLLKPGGFLIIEFKPFGKIKGFTLKKLRNIIQLLLKDGADIVFTDENKRNIACVVKKVKSLADRPGDIDEWTFGIVTNGKNRDRLEAQIQSIRRQKIPRYEIIVCGTYFERNEPDFRYIHFTEKDDLGWTTKKKNIICENAKYENLMILHDRIVLENGWFDGMKKYGNYFDALSCVVEDEDGIRRGDWFTWGGIREEFGRIGKLQYNDWDEWIVLDGAIAILKKSVWRRNRWDETLFWDQGEDINFSHSLTKNGFLIRFNPFARCKTLTWRHGEIPRYKKNAYRLGSRKGMFVRRNIWLIMNFLKKLGIKFW